MDNSVRQSPQNLEAEQAVLGSILVSVHPREAFEIASGKLNADDFSRPGHQLIFSAMEQLNDQQREIDVLTIQDQLGDKVNSFGGTAYFADLVSVAPSSANLEFYADIVRKKSLQRHLIETLTDEISRAYNPDEDISEYIGEVKNKLEAIEDDRQNIDFKTIKDALQDSLDKYYELGKTGGEAITGIATGFNEFDKVTTGLQPDQLIILAARPGVGKTAFVLNLAMNAANHLKNKSNENGSKPVVIFNMEMSATMLVDRMLSSQSSVTLQNIMTGADQDKKDSVGMTNYEKMTVAADKLSKLNLWIDDTPGIHINEIRAKLRRLVRDQKQEIGLVVIDYLQLIESSNREGRQQAVAEISRALKKLAMELRTPIIALSQLSRGVENRTNRRPILSDLRESGAIEQDADIVAFLYRDDYYENDEDIGDFMADPRSSNESDNSEVELIIEKNRQGERKTINLQFNKPYQKFASAIYMNPNNFSNLNPNSMPPIPPHPAAQTIDQIERENQ